MSDNIRVGDNVSIYFENCPCIFNVKVLYIPCQPGDYFTVKNKAGDIYKIQTFCYMKKINFPDKEEK